MKAQITLALLLVAGAANAQPATPNRTAVLQKLSECRALTADAARLACYDGAASGLVEAEAKGDIVVIDRDQARQVRRQAFGFTLPSLSLLDRGAAPDEAGEIVLKVESASLGGDGKWVLRLEGGQTWRQIDTAELARYPKAGGVVTIRRAMLGSYKLSTGGAAAIKVRRED